jgi:hypothetical protein
MPTTDLPPTPEERFHEVAAILAAGLLRLRTRPQIAATEDIPGEHAIPPESSESVQKSLGFPAPLRTNVHIG